MTRRIQVVVAAAVIGLAGGLPAPVGAQPASSFSTMSLEVARSNRYGAVTPGSIASLVQDPKGSPVAGAIVSAVGTRIASATTDAKGRCTIAALPPGEYLVRVHRTGFTVANSRIVRVVSGRVAAHAVVLTPLSLDRLLAEEADSNSELFAAGLVPAGTSGAQPSDEDDDHGHDETAWRLRHVRRSILKDSTEQVSIEQADIDDESASAFFGRAMTAPVRAAASLFSDAALNGQINLLTTSTFDSPAELLSDLSVARGVAYLSLGSSAGQRGDWNVQAALQQGDMASWMLAGSFIARQPAVHRYQAGMTYAAQRYTGRNPASIAAVADGSRSAGAVFAYDTWTLSRRVSLSYGARYSTYGYVDGPLFSPRATLSLQAARRLRLLVSASRRAEAPGAEEFVPGSSANAWLPPERTFSPLVGMQFTPERTDSYQVAVEHDLAPRSILAVRTFYQRTSDQVATVFGLAPLGEESTPDFDHYYVADAGDFEAHGWAVSITQIAGPVRGSIDYSVSAATWEPSAQAAVLEFFVPSAVRTGTERVHDLTTSIETEIPVSATRVFALYRVNTAFAGSAIDQEHPGTAARFDVQVTQALPFLNFSNAQWEALVGVRNMFREVALDGSLYDELLVSRPPKRVVGGVTVRF
jgi:hypothetical protein